MENTRKNSFGFLYKSNRGLIITIICLLTLPFIIALIDGQPFDGLFANEPGQSKFYQGLELRFLF